MRKHLINSSRHDRKINEHVDFEVKRKEEGDEIKKKKNERRKIFDVI